MKKLISSLCLCIAVTVLYANEIIISFQPKDNTETIDSIHATNLTRGQTVKLNSGESLIIASTTSSDLIIHNDPRKDYLYPNPTDGYTTLSFNTGQQEEVLVAIYNMSGQLLHSKLQSLAQGNHRFRFSFPTSGLYHINVLTNERQLSYKAVYTGVDQHLSEITHLGSGEIKAEKDPLKSAHNKKSLNYADGDIIHYTVFSGDNTTLISDMPKASKTIEVEFFECKDLDNRSYKIVQISNQWWMAENLAYLPSVFPSTSGSYTNSRYYVYGYQGYDAEEAKKTQSYRDYGVLYNWRAIMKSEASSNTIQSGVRGICPSGWHLPSDNEWNEFRDNLIVTGYNYDGTKSNNKIAKSLASNSNLWYTESSIGAIGNNLSLNNRSGFSSLPVGYRSDISGFFYIGFYSYWWSCTEYSNINFAWARYLSSYNIFLSREYTFKTDGLSVRCVKN